MSPTTGSTSTPSASGSTSNNAGATSPTDPLASESTFLTLLVSQLQNQDPLNPVDSSQFVSQLTSYSQLEQLIDIHANTSTLAAAVPPAATTPPAAAGATAAQPTIGA